MIELSSYRARASALMSADAFSLRLKIRYWEYSDESMYGGVGKTDARHDTGGRYVRQRTTGSCTQTLRSAAYAVTPAPYAKDGTLCANRDSCCGRSHAGLDVRTADGIRDSPRYAMGERKGCFAQFYWRNLTPPYPPSPCAEKERGFR